MRRRTLVGGAVVAGAAAVLLIWQGVGVTQTLPGGTQESVCVVSVGVAAAADANVALAWGGGGRATLSVGERTRVAPWCVIEIEGMTPPGDGEDGGGSVAVRWRPW